ncbi:MAG TPA: efflux RND transporter permease subunit [Acidimicrobiales bacterium]|nr:efflux RND transporter permease subunit [Acidimicrobiales bacterium]
MTRKLINSSLRFHVAAVAVALGVVLFGLTQVRQASVDVYPEFAPLLVEVQTEALGLSATEVEQLITVPLEADLLNGVAWVDDIRSASVPGLSSITLAFAPGTDLFRARQAVQERLAQAHALPNVSKPPQMLQPVSSTSRTMLIGLSSSTLSLIDISQLARWTIKPRLQGVEGVANVSSFGQRERQLQVQVDPRRLHDKGVSLLQVVETAGNALVVSPLSFLEASTPGTGGFIESPQQRLGVRHVSPIESAADLAQVAVAGRTTLAAPTAPAIDETTGEPVPPPPPPPQLRLGDVAQVVEDHQPLIGDALVNNGPGLVLVVEKLRGANTVDVAEGVEDALAALRPGLRDLKIDASIYRPADYVRTSSGNVGMGLLVGIGLVILLLAFAFYQWRRALVSAATIITSLVAAGSVLYLTGQTFNAMTLAGLALALGVVIDDAIAGSERVARRLQAGGDRSAASTITDASAEVRGPLAYATLFVLLPVLPLFFVGNLLGAFGRPLAVSYALAVLVSMAVALLLTPALSLLLLSKPAHAGRRESALVAKVGPRYNGLLERVLGAPARALALVGLIALVGVVLIPQLRHAELPSLHEADLMVDLRAAPGTSLVRMKEITSDVTGQLSAIPGVRNVTSHEGRAVTGDQVVDVNSAGVWVSLDEDADYSTTVEAIEDVLDGYPDLDAQVESYQQTRVAQAGFERGEEGSDSPIAVRVYGNEPDLLAQKADEVGTELSKIDGIDDLQVDLPVAEPTLEVEVSLEKASQFGVKPGDVRRAAAILLSGIDVGQLFYDQKVFDVVVWGAPETRKNQDDVRALLIETPGGTQVRLDQVADVRLVDSPDVIEREGVFRRIDITAEVSGRSRGDVAADVEKAIEAIDFPLEYRAELLGDFAAGQAEQRRSLLLAGFAGLAMLLVLQACFGNWRLGTALFLSLPLALSGGAAAAFALAGDVTVGAALGLLVVLGIAARNGILLVTRYQEMERREEHGFGSALVVQGARERLAPTLMTAAATVLMFLPVIVLGARPGYELLRPMGMVVLGGLVTSTLVSLFVVPALYLLFARVRSDTELDVGRFEDELLLMDAAGNFGPTDGRADGRSASRSGAGTSA